MQGDPTLFLVEASASGQRLDQFLTAALGGTHSRSHLSAFIKGGAVTVNGILVSKPGACVHTHDSVAITIPQPPLFPLPPTPVAFDVIAEEKDFLIINKPAGLMVHHAASAPEQITLVHGLLARYPEFARFESNERPGIVHRLDKDTSGLLVVARNPQALTALAALFKSRSLEKKYHALVTGWPEKAGTYDKPIGRHPVKRHLMTVGGIAPRTACTHYRVLEYFSSEASLLECTIVTGRTHQIRVHCAAAGFPLVGDKTYGSSHPAIDRQALHAHSLAFTYRGVAYAYTAPYPPEFAAALARLRGKKTES